MKLRTLLLLGVLAYLGFLTAQLPAARIAAWVGPLPGHVQVSGIEGSAFSGSAAVVQWKEWRFESVTWSFRPLSLIMGHLELELTFHNADGSGRALVGATVLRQFYLADLHARIQVSALEPLWRPSVLSLSGWVVADIDHFAWPSSGPELTGQAILENIRWESKPPLPLGDFLVTLGTDPAKSELHGQITDRAGSIETKGQFQINPPGLWKVMGTVAPRPNAPAALRQILSFSSKPDREGRFPIAFNGKL